MHLRTTFIDWLHDLRRLMHDPTRISAIVRSFARPVVRLIATGRKRNRCMRSKFCSSPNIHHRLYVLQIDRNRTTNKSYDPVWLSLRSRSTQSWFTPSPTVSSDCGSAGRSRRRTLLVQSVIMWNNTLYGPTADKYNFECPIQVTAC